MPETKFADPDRVFSVVEQIGGGPAIGLSGQHWGFLRHFRLNDYIFTELVVSRDGMTFDRMPGRHRGGHRGPPSSKNDKRSCGGRRSVGASPGNHRP